MKNSLQINSKYLDSDILIGSSILRTMSHLFIMPTLIASAGFYISAVVYIALICLMQVLRCKINPTEENLIRKDTFFSIISFCVITTFCVLVFFILISLI